MTRRDTAVHLLAAVALWLLLHAQPAWPQADAPVLRLGPAQDIHPLAPHTTWLHDRRGDLDLATVRSLAAAGEFAPVPRSRQNFGYVEGALWFRFRIENLGPERERWLLVIEYALLDHVTLFRVDPDGRIGERQSGDRTPFSTRDRQLRNLNFELDLAPSQPVELYLRVVSESSMQVPLVLARPAPYLESLLPTHLGLGIYYGIQLALLLYNLILWVSVRDRNFLWYVLYATSLGLLLLCLNGLAFEYLWPDLPDWGNLAVPVGIALSNLCMLQFTRSFLDLQRHAPRADRVLLGGMLAAALPALAAFVLPYRLVIQYQTLLALLLAPVILVSAVLCLRRYAPARHFLVAWSALLFGIVVYAAVSLGVLPKVPLTEYSLQIGSAAEMILLSFALAYRINVLKADNERIQSEAREQLEARVRARTAELDATMHRLEDANARLQDFSRRDGLTGVYNRRHLDDITLQHCLMAREKVQPLALLMIDVDHFKQINDRHGHLIGDDSLRAIAQVLERHVRGTAAVLARYGGEEFAIVLPDAGLDAARSLAEAIRADVEAQTLRIETLAIRMTVSIGIYAVPPGYPCSAPDLLRHADSALYAAKRAGRNRVEVAGLV
jgi:two-component system, sensor histidine kinase LadS